MGVDRRMNKKHGKQKVPSAFKGMRDKEEQMTLTNVAYNLVKFAEVSRAVLIKVQNEKRKVENVEMFRLQCNIEFAINILTQYFELEPSYLQEMADAIVKEESFKDSVNQFADKLAPEGSVLVTKDIQRQFKEATTVNQFAKGVRK